MRWKEITFRNALEYLKVGVDNYYDRYFPTKGDGQHYYLDDGMELACICISDFDPEIHTPWNPPGSRIQWFKKVKD